MGKIIEKDIAKENNVSNNTVVKIAVIITNNKIHKTFDILAQEGLIILKTIFLVSKEAKIKS